MVILAKRLKKVTAATASKPRAKSPVKRAMSVTKGAAAAKKPQLLEGQLVFEYIKSSDFRTLHIDGIFGGLAPQGRFIHMAVFAERHPLPQKTFHALKAGMLGPEDLTKREGRVGIVRELEADLVMDIETARSMHEWLGVKIQEMTLV